MQNHIRTLILLVLTGLSFNLTVAQLTILDETLLTQASYNTFTPVSVTGDQNWTFSSSYGAVCTGYVAGQNYANDNWLISSTMNLTQADNVTLSFRHTRGSASVLNVGVAEGWYKAYATADYTGDVSTTQWVELTGFNQNVSFAWGYINSGFLVIPEAAQSATTRIAFRYQSSNTQSATWEIKNVKVTGQLAPNPNMSVFKITNWNTQWLGCASFGPTDETLQLNNVVTAMQFMNSDIYCLQEVTNSIAYPTIASLVNLLGSDVWDGAIVPSTTDDCDQRQGIIYKKNRVQLVSSTLLNNGNDAQGNSYYYNWSSGRYPALYKVNLITESGIEPLTIVNIHAKAEDGNPTSYTRRLGGSEGLKAILDGSNYNADRLLFIGDFNDFLQGTFSTSCSCTNSPYKNFMDDTANYTGLTQNIFDTYVNRPIIENIMMSNELVGNYVPYSVVQEVPVSSNAIIPNYLGTTSDHIPVSAQFQFQVLSNPQYELTSRALVLYPNPVTNALHFETTALEDQTAVAVYDLTGREMRCEKVTANSINVGALPVGVYLLKVGNRIGRFVKE
ncbi:T9SS type A sorting domain-containing protein [Flavobacterium capsici]|uniref:T9SS type A sorting domain-containing protein n=1 Tax=Flavobacterium capsici TaxID=3075618 RepID=A0AA96F204_9FLAO|nr:MULTISPECIES: T9SS type A sorting domain-containing protein [unclassified Flavobacterium]WNM19775.1 T9SS type A sorting domain-containing protein [Flavobacterium sp. PMR2A8]WNM21164.1 T9SS type A sorting domain-containing protein [Flavobacterium sp. PMTSA4]